MYSVRNFVRFSVENRPSKSDLTFPWNLGRTKDDAEEVLLSLSIDFCWLCPPPLADDLVGISGD